MLRFLIFGFCGVSLLAQTAGDAIETAPPPVEQALRDHVTQFFQAYVDGKWRVAEHLVADDSLDTFLGADKDRLIGFEIVKMRFHENFTKAEVVVLTRRYWLLQGRRIVEPMAQTTFWKVVGGQWMWYAPPRSSTVNTPFGVMSPGPENAKPSAAIPADPLAAAADIMNQVKVDKTEVQLSSYRPASEEVTISNAMPGKIELRAEPDLGFPGFTAKLEKTELKGGETGKLLLNVNPKDKTPKPTIIVRLRVMPLNKIIPIRVTFDIPPEIKRQLPKQP